MWCHTEHGAGLGSDDKQDKESYGGYLEVRDILQLRALWKSGITSMDSSGR